jgi:predicted SAM-dependent methyltransferase
MKVITGILSCASRLSRTEAIRQTYFNALPNPFFFRGASGQPIQRDGDALTLDVEDTYEHLPRKMFRLYEHLLRSESFDFFLKIDDDCYVYTALLELFIRQIRTARASLTHYMGSRILHPDLPRSTVWHVGKITDPTFSHEYRGAFKHSYCSGGDGYLLSRRAMEVIVERGRDQFLNDRELYEDKCHGDVLAASGFLPTLMPSGVILSDLSPEQILELHTRQPTSLDRKIQLGTGPNELLGWENYDRDVDLRKALPFADSSVRFLFAEHVVEHISPKDAWSFFRESRRVLMRDGILRVVVPSVVRVVERWTPAYLQFLANHGWTDGSLEAAVAAIIKEHEHRAVWSVETLRAVLIALGFQVREFPVGESDTPELRNLEKHGLQIGEDFNRLESVCLEAKKIDLPKPARLNGRPPRKLAFLFLTRSNHHQSVLWQEFLSGHEREFTLHTHAKYRHAVSEEPWRGSLIPQHVATQWGHVSLVHAMLALLRQAMHDPYNHKFIFVSEACVPIKPFSTIHQSLTGDERGRMAWEHARSVAKRSPEKARRMNKSLGIPRQYWFYHGQWLALNRETAGLLLDHDQSARFEHVFAADECYFATVLAMLGCNLARHFSRAPLTHADWCRPHPRRPFIYEQLASKDIEMLRSSPCLFARKFVPQCNIKGLGLHLELH